MVDPAPQIRLSDGLEIPAVGYGTYPHGEEDSQANTEDALAVGYRLLDTALRYENEEEVGRGVAASPVPRDEIVVLTKIPGRHHGREGARTSAQESLRNLGLDRIDVLLIHWPLPRLEQYVDTWRTMIDLREEGLVRSIGVSNFEPDHIKRLQDETGVTPSLNQVELHPYFTQEELRRFHAQHGIVTMAWSPLGRGGELLEEPELVAIADELGVTVGQVVLRWHVQNGVVPIPKTKHRSRMAENLDVFGFELTDEQMRVVGSKERGRIWGQHPNTHEEF